LRQDSIWDNSELFLRPVSEISQFDALLAGSSALSIDTEIMSEPFGPHYSTTLPKQTNDPLKARLILPPSVFDESRADRNCQHVHNRLLSAFVLLTFDDDPVPPPGSEDETMPNLRDGREDLNRLISGSTTQQAMSKISATPTSEGLGVSPYGMLGFDNKLMLELESLGLTGERPVITDTNCPVVRSMAYQIEQQEEISRKANEMKRVIREKIQDNKKCFEDRVKVRNNWDATLKEYLQSQQQEQARPAKKKKAKHPHIDEYD
jgi:hypothetical protein